MGSIVIRNLDDSLKSALKVRAAKNGKSMEAEVRDLIKESLSHKQETEIESAGQIFSRLFGEKAGADLEEYLPVRQEGRGPIEF